MDNYNRNKKDIYKRRRLIAGVISLGILLALSGLIIKIFSATSSKGADGIESDKILTTSEIGREPREVDKFVEANSMVNIFENSVKTVDDAKALKELQPYRLQTKRNQAMGRGPKQSLLNKEVYLTFDDGPSSEITNKILDVLKDQEIKATFFVIGKHVETYPDILKRIYDEGHAIGIHTYSHDYKTIYSNPDALQRDIEQCLQAIRGVLGEDFNTNLYRFPGGSFRKNKEIFINRIEEIGYIYFDWNVLNGDAEGNNLSETYLIDRFNETSKGYNIVLSLMHDTNSKMNTVNTLPQIIKMLRTEGYTFKSLGAI